MDKRGEIKKSYEKVDWIKNVRETRHTESKSFVIQK